MQNRLTTAVPRTILYGTYVYDERVHRGILRYGRQHGWKVLMLQPHAWAQAEGVVADGIISMMEPDAVEPETMTAHLLSRELPRVSLSTEHAEGALVLLPDAKAAAREAGRYFQRLGLPHWLHVCYGRTWHDELRLAGFSEAAEAAGVPWEVIELREPKNLTADTLRRKLAEQPKPVGVFCSFDSYAEQVLDVCRSAGIAVPEEVAILGCYNHELYSVFSAVPLSTIDMGLEARGYQAAALLDGLMRGEPVPDEPLWSPVAGVIERASTSPLSTRDTIVAQAVHFIEGQHHRPLMVGEVAEAMGISRAALQRRFEAAFGHGVAHEITRLKMKRAAKLLAETEDTGAMIAASLGYPDALNFYRVFKRVTGTTTKAYRAGVKS